jgi:OOP family OmpA-OmpF porin
MKYTNIPLTIAIASASWFLAGVALAQSTISLDKFDIGNAKVEDAQPDFERSAASCLLNAVECENRDTDSPSFSLDDVMNLGIVDRSSVNEGMDTAQTAEPLPSIDLEVLFEYASDALRNNEISELYDLARDLRDIDFTGKQLVLMGHTDGVGSRQYNHDLSQRRAESVATFLSREAGIPRYQIRTAGMGFDYLKYPSDPENGANRRVQILMVEG